MCYETKVVTWLSREVSVEAETEEEAINKIINNDEEVEILDGHFIDDYLVTPFYNNEGMPIINIRNEDGDLVFSDSD